MGAICSNESTESYVEAGINQKEGYSIKLKSTSKKEYSICKPLEMFLSLLLSYTLAVIIQSSILSASTILNTLLVNIRSLEN